MNREIDILILNILLLKKEAGRLELWQTMHKLDEVQTTVGYEYAEKLEKEKQIKKQEQIIHEAEIESKHSDWGNRDP